MEQNTRVSPVITVLKKIWPTFYQIINGSIYFLATVIRGIIKGIISQLKGM